MPMPIIVKPRLQLEPLSGEAGIQRFGARDLMCPAPGQPDGGPDDRPRAVGHLHRPVQVIDVDHEQRGRGVDARDDRMGRSTVKPPASPFTAGLRLALETMAGGRA
jgi:hypothetical protein